MAIEEASRTGFRISRTASGAIPGEDAAGSIPAFSEPALVFAIPRDPRTLFVYWNVNWGSAFAVDPPNERRVYLRVLKQDGTVESESLVEPLLGSFYAPIQDPGTAYRAELGYYTSSDHWKSVGASELVALPPESFSENTVVDVATVPFHLSFQKLIDLFSQSEGGDPLAVAIARVQQRALKDNGEELSPNEQAALRAMDISLADLRAARRSFAERPNEAALRKRAEAILGFGATSPSGGFGESSPSGGSSGGGGRS